MIPNQADNIMFGSHEVQKVFLGNELVWERNKQQYDETKIAVVLLDENMQKTSNIQYVDTLAEASQILASSPDDMFHIEAGTQSSVVPYWNSYFNEDNIYSVKIPEGVKKISKYAFNGCGGLTKVQLPETLEEIEESQSSRFEGAFSYCTSLRNINIPVKMKSIPKNFLSYCTALTDIEIPDSCLEISYHAFRNCTALTSIEIPDSCLEIYPAAFYNCTSLASVDFGNGIKKIGGNSSNDTGAFEDCTSITSVTIPSSINEIGYGTFKGCTSLNSVTIQEGVSKIDGLAFYNCTSLKNLTLSTGITEIGNLAFALCTSLQNVIIPDGVISIGTGTFYGCSSLKSIYLPSSVRNLGATAPAFAIFQDCYSLSAIIIPENVSEIGAEAFRGCTKLKQIKVKNTRYSLMRDPWGAPNFISTAQYDDLREKGEPIPKGKTIVNWDGAGDEDELADKILIKELNADGTVKRYNTVKSTGYLKDFLQENPDKLYAVDIGALCIGKEDSPTYATITAESFSGITNLKGLYIPDTFRTIEEDAFSGCTNLDYVQIGGQKERISGEPWGADSSTTEFYYSANLVNLDGETLMAADDIYPYLAVKTQQTNATYETGLSGILKVSAESGIPVEKTLYIISENNAFSLKLGDKELTL